MKKTRSSHSSLFVAITTLFVACLLVSNIVAGKLISFAGTFLPAAVILFPLTYIMGDILTEVYGFARARMVIWLGFAANALMSLVFLIVVALPFPDFFQNQTAFATVLGFAPRIVVASLIAYWAGEFANSIVLSALKKTTKGRYLWIRTIGSTIVGQAVDTAFFITIAFAGTLPADVLLTLVLNQYLFKVVYEVVLTPVTYVVVRIFKKTEGIDTFDTGVRYNPFASRSNT